MTTLAISSALGLSEAENAEIIEWLEELEGSCSPTRVSTVIAKLSCALESIMGIEKEILHYVFLADYQRRRK